MTSYSRSQKLKRIKWIDFIFPLASLFILFRETHIPKIPFSDKDQVYRLELNREFKTDQYSRFFHQPIIVNFLDEILISSTNTSQFYTISPSVEQSLAMEDLNLIELLWRQDIDLGISKDSFDTKTKYDPFQDDIFQQNTLSPESRIDPSFQFKSFDNYTIDNETGELLPSTNSKMCVEYEYSQDGYSQDTLCINSKDKNLRMISMNDFYKDGQTMLYNLTKKLNPSDVDYSAEKQAIISSWIHPVTNPDSFNETIFNNVDELFTNSILLSPSSLIGNDMTYQNNVANQTAQSFLVNNSFPIMYGNSQSDLVPRIYNEYEEVKEEESMSVDPTCNTSHLDIIACNKPISVLPFDNISMLPFDSISGTDKALNTFNANIFLNDINYDNENFLSAVSLKNEIVDNPLFQVSRDTLGIDASLSEFHLDYPPYDTLNALDLHNDNPLDETKLQNFTCEQFLMLDNDSFEQFVDTNFSQDINISSSFSDLPEMRDIAEDKKTRGGRIHHNHTYATPIGQPTKKKKVPTATLR